MFESTEYDIKQQQNLEQLSELLSESQNDNQSSERTSNLFEDIELKQSNMETESLLISNENFEFQSSNEKSEKLCQVCRKKRLTKHWTNEEDQQLKTNFKKYNGKWPQISKVMCQRNKSQCSQRWRRLYPGKTRQPWTPEQDDLVIELVQKYGKNWGIIATQMEEKSGKQIRERYINKLDTTINHEKWSEQEDQIILDKYQQIGARWSEISKNLSGRPENWVKNRFYSHLQKQLPNYYDSTSQYNVTSSYASQIQTQDSNLSEETPQNTEFYVETQKDQISNEPKKPEQYQTEALKKSIENSAWSIQLPNPMDNEIYEEKEIEQTIVIDFSPTNILSLQKISIKKENSFKQENVQFTQDHDLYQLKNSTQSLKASLTVRRRKTKIQSFKPENASFSEVQENYCLTLAYQQRRQSSDIQFDINRSQNQEENQILHQHIDNVQIMDNMNSINTSSYYQSSFKNQCISVLNKYEEDKSQYNQEQIQKIDYDRIKDIETSLQIKEELEQKLSKINGIIIKQCLAKQN